MDEDCPTNPSSPKRIKLEVEDSGLLSGGFGHSTALFPARGNTPGNTGTPVERNAIYQTSGSSMDTASSVQIQRATVDAREVKVETYAEKENVVPSVEENIHENFDMAVGSSPEVKREAGEEFSDNNINILENVVVPESPNVQNQFVDVLQSSSDIQKGTENTNLEVKAEIQEEFSAHNVSTVESAAVPELPISSISLNDFLQSVIDIQKGVENTCFDKEMETQEEFSAPSTSTVEKEVVPELPNTSVNFSEKGWNAATQFSSDIENGSLTEQIKNNNNHVDNVSGRENSRLSVMYLHPIQTIEESSSPTPSGEEIPINITDLASNIDVDPRGNLLEQADKSVLCNKSSSIREDDVVFVPEIPNNEYEVIDLTEDFAPASPASTLTASDHLDSVMDVADATFPTPLLNYHHLNFDSEIICQLSLENLFLEDNEEKKEQIGLGDVIASSDLPKPLTSSLLNVKTEEQDIFIEENLCVESGTSSSQNTKTNASSSMQESLTSAPDCSGVAVDVMSSLEDIYSSSKDSQFHSAPTTDPISKDKVAEEVELVFSSSGANLNKGGSRRKRPSKRQRSVVPSKKPKHPEVQVGNSGTKKVLTSTPKIDSASLESNVEQNAAENISQQTPDSQAKSSPASSEISDTSSNNKLNVTESRLREGISPRDPRRKAVPLPSKKPQVSSPHSLSDSYTDVLGLQPMSYHSGQITGSHAIYPSPYSFQSGPAPYFAGPVATMNTYSQYFPVQCPGAFAETVVHHPQPLPYPMMYPSPAQMGDMSHMMQYPMVHSFSHAQMDVSSYAYGPMPYPMNDVAQMSVPQAMDESSVPENIDK